MSSHKLRLNSVWALKHLVNSAPESLKMECLNKLGVEWLKQMLGGSQQWLQGYQRNGKGTPITMGTPNAAGEQVDLLNTDYDPAGNSHGLYDDPDDEVNMIDSPSVTSDVRHTSTAFHRVQTSDSQSYAYSRSRRDAIAIQEQGLDFIRNLVCGKGAPELIDHILQIIGRDNFFSTIATLLRPRYADASIFERAESSAGSKLVSPPEGILTSAVFIIVHIANSRPEHRNIVVAQSRLLDAMMPLFSNASSQVRSCCVWLVINLTWVDDQSERPNCRARAWELRKLGIMEKLREMEEDEELDVRERAKTALHQMLELSK